MNNTRKNDVRFDHENCTIVCTKAFLKKAGSLGTAEAKLLKAYKAEYPSYSVTAREIYKNESKKTYSGLTIDAMRDYIDFVEGENSKAAVAEFNRVVALSEVKGSKYSLTKGWFFKHYPEYKNSIVEEEQVKAMAAEKTEAERKTNAEQANLETIAKLEHYEPAVRKTA